MEILIVILLIGTFLMSVVSSSAHHVVAKDGSGQFTSIADAIKAARTYEEILVKPGEYNETIVIEGKQELRITAEGEVWLKAKDGDNALTLIDCYKMEFNGFHFTSGVVLRNKSEVIISGCTFTGTNTAIEADGCRNLGIYGNTFSNGTSTVIAINDCRQTKIINNVFYNNKGAEGIRLTNSDSDVISNNTIAYNQFVPVSMNGECRAKIRNNVIAFNTIPGPEAVIQSKGRIEAFCNNFFQNKNTNGEAIAYENYQSETDLIKDPMFVNGKGGNFSLSNNSPCMGAGKGGDYGEIPGMNMGADLLAKGKPLVYKEQFDEGVAQFKKGKHQEAIEIFNRLLITYPGNQNLWSALGEFYLGMKRYTHAIDACSKALKIKSDLGDALFNLAVAYTNTGKAADALPLLDKALANRMDETEVLIAQGDCYTALKKFDAAHEVYQKALEKRYGDDPKICYKMVRAFVFEGKTKDAVSWLNKAVKYGIAKDTVESDPDLEAIRKTEDYFNLKKEYSFW